MRDFGRLPHQRHPFGWWPVARRRVGRERLLPGLDFPEPVLRLFAAGEREGQLLGRGFQTERQRQLLAAPPRDAQVLQRDGSQPPGFLYPNGFGR
jgi:hypothetical protein